MTYRTFIFDPNADNIHVKPNPIELRVTMHMTRGIVLFNLEDVLTALHMQKENTLSKKFYKDTLSNALNENDMFINPQTLKYDITDSGVYKLAFFRRCTVSVHAAEFAKFISEVVVPTMYRETTEYVIDPYNAEEQSGQYVRKTDLVDFMEEYAELKHRISDLEEDVTGLMDVMKNISINCKSLTNAINNCTTD